MVFDLQQEDFDALYQAHKELRAKVELYEYTPDANGVFTFRQCDEITGVVMDGDIQVDADSDVRRTCNLTLHTLDSSFVVTTEQRLWINKYVHLQIGYQSDRTGNILWYEQGFFILQSISSEYSSSSRTVRISLGDLTLTLDGTLGGDIWGAPVKIPADSQTIQRAMRDIVIQRGNWTKVWIDPMGPYGKEEVTTQNRVPYTIEMTDDSTVMDVVIKLRDLYPGYETYFDLDGTFKCGKIPDCMDDPVAMTHEQIYPLVIEETANNLDFSGVRNVTEIWGHEYDDESSNSTYYADTCQGANGNYALTCQSFVASSLDDNMVFMFLPNHDNTSGQCTININGLGSVPLVMYVPGAVDDKEIPAGFIRRNEMARIKYERGRDNQRRFVYIGRTKIHVVHKLVSKEPTWTDKLFDMEKYNCHNITYSVNPESPLTVERIGERHQVLSGGNYDNIMNESDGADTASYETWKATNLAFTLSLETTLIPWLDVNQKIGYYSPLFQMIDREHGVEPNFGASPQYIIKRISRSLSTGRQTMELTRFYPLYPFIISDSQIHTS